MKVWNETWFAMDTDNWKDWKSKKDRATQFFHGNAFKINDVKFYLFVERLKKK